MSDSISCRPLTTSGFGVEISDVDVEHIDDRDRENIRDHYHASGGLLLIRNQQYLSADRLCAFVAMFGALERNEKYDPAFLLPGCPEILKIGNVKENGAYAALFIQADPPPLLWHTDDSFRHPQPIGSCLFCVHTPPQGGETGFAGMHAAYEALPEDMKQKVDGLTAVHSYDHLNELLRLKNPHRPPLSEDLKRQMPPLERPLVAQHPVTHHKGLYIPLCHIETIKGMSDEASRRLLDDLLEHTTRPEFTYMHAWRPGDVVVWDNRSALHAPTPFDNDRYERLMYRLTFNGEQILGF